MTTVEVHGAIVPPNAWWACHYPERPPHDELTYFDERCRACTIALRAAIETGRFGIIHFHGYGDERITESLTPVEAVERFRL